MREGYSRKRCVVCGVPRDEAVDGFISTRGKCKPCGLALQLQNCDGIEAGQGIAYQRWRLGIASRIFPREVVGAMFRSGFFTDEADVALDDTPVEA